MHIPIDYIAGTSMGSIVGGLYATGATTQDLETLIAKTNWVEIFSDRPPRDKLPFRVKDDDRRYIEGLEMGLDSKGLHFSKGLINGQKLMFLLENNTLKASAIQDFDDLPIPFRCVSTDIVTGERYVFSKGSLPLAIRSSMSLPAIFAPVEHEGHLLVDGGIADNLPVDVVRAMGADVVIAVDVGTPPLDRSQINSPLAVYGQVLNILMQKEIDVQAKNATLLLRPDLGRFSNMDFPNSLKLIPIGEKLVEDNATTLAKYAVSAEEYAAWEARVRGLPPPPSIIDFLEFAGTDPLDEGLLRGRMSTKPGEPMNMANLQKDLLLVYNTGNYASVDYQVVQRGDKKGVVITAKPNPTGPNYMQFGMELSSDFRYNSNWSVFAGLRFTRLNHLGAEWKSDVEIGLNQRLYTEWYQPLSRSGQVFVAPYLKYTNELDYVFVNSGLNNPSASYRTKMTWLGADLGFNMGLSGELRIGPRWGNGYYSRSVGPELFPSFNASLGGYLADLHVRPARFSGPSHQGAPCPGDGLRFGESAGGLGQLPESRAEDPRLSAHWASAAASSSTSLAGPPSGPNVPYYDWFRLGGPGSFGGYMEGQLAGPYYGAVRLGYQYKFATLPAIIGKGAYFMAFTDVGKPWIFEFNAPGANDDMKYSGTIGFGSSTKLGPVFFGYSYATRRQPDALTSASENAGSVGIETTSQRANEPTGHGSTSPRAHEPTRIKTYRIGRIVPMKANP